MTDTLPRETLDRKVRALGAVVLAWVEFEGDGIGAPGRIILAEKLAPDGCRFVVWWQNRQTGGCSDGGYHDTVADAFEDLAKRARIEETYAARRTAGGLDGTIRVGAGEAV